MFNFRGIYSKYVETFAISPQFLGDFRKNFPIFVPPLRLPIRASHWEATVEIASWKHHEEIKPGFESEFPSQHFTKIRNGYPLEV